ncbi:hypothetical protein GCM10027347_17800 [Larkinella harenae]
MNDVEISKIKLLIDGEEGEATLKQLKEAVSQVTKEMQKLEKAGEDGKEPWKELSRLMVDLTAKVDVVTDAVNNSDASLYELTNKSRKLNNELKDLKTGSDEWIAKMEKIGEVDAKMIEVRQEMARIKKEALENSEAYQTLKKRQEEVNEEMKAMVRNIDLNDASMGQLKAKSNLLNEELKDLKVNSTEWIAKMKEIDQVDNKLREVGQEMDALRTHTEKNVPVMDRLKDSVSTFAALQLDNLVDRIVDFGRESISTAAQNDDAMADIAKATEMVIEDVVELNEQLKKIDTRTSVEELQQMAVAAGQFGVAKEDVLGFVESTDKLNIALGDQFSSTEELATTTLRLRNIFQDIKTDNIGDDMLYIGNALNALEGAGSASASVMADFSSRMGGVLIPLGMTTPQILGLSASLEEMNVTAERGSTAVTAIVQKMLTDVDRFAKVAGMSTKDFTALIEQDLFGALMKFAEGSKRSGDSSIVFANILKDTSLSGSGAMEVLSKLANSQGLVTDKVGFASQVIKEQNSVLLEFDKKNTNSAAQLAKMGKEVTNMSVELGQKLIPIVISAGQGMLTFVNTIRAVPQFINENKAALAALVVGLVSFNTTAILAAANSVKLSAAKKAEALASELAAAAEAIRTRQTAAAAVADNTAAAASQKLTIQERLAAAQTTISNGLTATKTALTNAWTIAQNGINTALRANPIGAVITVLAMLAAGLVMAYEKSETFRGIVNGVWAALKTGVQAITEITGKCYDWIRQSLEPLGQKLEPVGRLLGPLWDLIKQGVGLWVNLQTTIAQFIASALGGLINRIEPLKTLFSALWSVIAGGVEKIKAVGAAMANFLPIDSVISKIKDTASKMGVAFSDAYSKEINAARAADEKADAAHNSKKTANAKASANQSAEDAIKANQGANDAKGLQNTQHLTKEQEKEKKHAEKVADDKKKANADALKSIEELKVQLISNELQREVAKENLKYQQQLATIKASLASEENKRNQIELLEKVHTEKVADLKANAQKKQDQLLERWLDDEYTRKIKKAQQFANDEIAIAKATFGQTAEEQEKLAQIIKKIEASLATEIIAIRKDKDDKDTEARKKKENEEHAARLKTLAAEKDLFSETYKAAVASADLHLQLAKTNADAIYQAKLEKLKAEHEYNRQKLENEAQAEKEKNKTRIQDLTARAAAETKIDEDLKNQLALADAKFEADKKALHREHLEARKKEISDFFTAVEGLMQGDFVSFTNFILQKLANAKRANEEENRDWKEKMADRLEMAAAMVQGLQALNQAYLNSQLQRIQREKDARISAVQEQISNVSAQEDAYEARKAALEQQMRMARTEAERQELRQKMENLEMERMGREEYWRQVEARQRQYQQDMAALEQQMREARTEAEKQELQQKIDNLKEEQTANEKMLEDIADAETKYQEDKKELEDKLRKARTDAEKKELQQKLTNLETEKKGTVATKKDMETEIARINAEAAENEKQEKLKAWKRDQALQISMALINAAQAALKSLATMGWPLGLVGVAASAVAAGIQIAMIKKQAPPSYAKGGVNYVKNAGVVKGDRHGSRYGEAGISMVNRRTGEEVGELEGDEPVMILSRNTYKNNKGVVDMLLNSSLHKNGAPIFRDGGMYDDYVGRRLSYGRGGVAWRMFADGGEYYDSGADMGGVASSEPVNSAAEATALTTEEIQKSQELMESIGKNTENTVLALEEMIDYLATTFLPTVKQQNDALALEVKNKLSELIAADKAGNEYLVASLKQQLDAIIGNGGTANGYLERIAAKDLSVQTFVHVMNHINVVAGDSNLK